MPVVLKPNSPKWRWLTSWQGRNPVPISKAKRIAVTVVKRYRSRGEKPKEAVYIALNASKLGSNKCTNGTTK
jgi:hypothetical protein